MTNEELVKQIQENVNVSENLERLYTQNKGIIHRVIKQYSYIYKLDSGQNGVALIEYQELMNSAYFGLLEAVKRFDGSTENKFISYAKHWIRHNIQRYIEECNKSIRLPSYIQQKITQYKKIHNSYQMQNGYTPTDTYICEKMNITNKTLTELKIACQTQYTESLDLAIPDSEDLLMEDCVADPNVNIEESIIDSIINDGIQTDLWKIVEQNVNQAEYQVLIARFKNNMTLAAIGEEMGLSSERIRQIETRALQRLRSSRVKKMLSDRLGV